jgi:hypothetical protein
MIGLFPIVEMTDAADKGGMDEISPMTDTTPMAAKPNYRVGNRTLRIDKGST